MTLRTSDFKIHRSLRKTIAAFSSDPACEIRFDSAFEQVISACAGAPREGQAGTWILPEMVAAYGALHAAGHAHSVETWVDGELVGGLYCVNIGRMVFGESMFAHRTDASKLALSALVAFCRAADMPMIDCQQNTRHLASLGAAEIDRAEFLSRVQGLRHLSPPRWKFEPVYWNLLLTSRTSSSS